MANQEILFEDFIRSYNEDPSKYVLTPPMGPEMGGMPGQMPMPEGGEAPAGEMGGMRGAGGLPSLPPK